MGGIIVNGDAVPEIERQWLRMKRAASLDGRPVKYSMSWPKPELRIYFVEQIGSLPLKAVAALLEDFRPDQMKRRKETRSEAYVHLRAFDYVLQRLPESIYRDSACSPNVVVRDHRDDFKRFSDAYAKCHPKGWTFSSHRGVARKHRVRLRPPVHARRRLERDRRHDRLLHHALGRGAGGRREGQDGSWAG